MTKKNDGGPAFPQAQTEYFGGEPSTTRFNGMSLRDWFAGQAMVGMLAGRGGYLQKKFMPDEAKFAYDYADAMLAARDAQD